MLLAAPSIPLTIEYRLHPKQRRAYRSPATEILYGGAAGGGKSHLMRIASIMWCCRIPGLQCYLFRRNFEDLHQNHMEGPTGFVAILAPLVQGGWVRMAQHRIRFWNGSRISLNHLQYTSSLDKYQGADIHVLLMDELTHFTEHEYRYLRGRVRMGTVMQAALPDELKGSFPRILSGSNPGGVGHAWVKRTFIQSEEEERYEPLTIYEKPTSEGGKLRQFIPARLEDNPSLNREEYEATLEGLGDPQLIRALKEGDWDVVAGSMFGDAWHSRWHGVPWHVHQGFAIPDTWPLWRSGDDGFEAPSAIYWFTEDRDRGTLYVIDELYVRHMLPEELARLILEREREIMLVGAYNTQHPNMERLTGYYDSSAFVSMGQADSTGAKAITRGEQMNRLGCRWKPVEKWSGSRIAGVKNFHRLLQQNKRAPLLRDARGELVRGPDGKELHDRPSIVFFAKCVNAIRTIPALPRSDRNLEDIADGADDHAFDGVRYGIQYRIGKARVIGLAGL